jgi:hypothetical protein
VHIGWSSLLHCQELMFEVDHRSQGGIIHINYTHRPYTVCVWHLKTITFASHYTHSHHYTFQLKAKFNSLPFPHCIHCISSVTHSSLTSLFGNML